MHPDTLTGPLAIFLQGLAFVLVAGALFVLVHALGRKAERWKHAWSRWVWVVLAAEYVLSFAAAMIVTNDTTATVFGFSYFIALVVELTYLLRVVFPAQRTDSEDPSRPPSSGDVDLEYMRRPRM